MKKVRIILHDTSHRGCVARIEVKRGWLGRWRLETALVAENYALACNKGYDYINRTFTQRHIVYEQEIV